MRFTIVAIPILAALALTGCAGDKKTKTAHAPETSQQRHAKTSQVRLQTQRPDVKTTVRVRSLGAEETAGQIEVAPEIARVCQLPNAYFAFDSAQITGDAAEALNKLANCFTEGALKGRTMKIVGHADPRGSDEYNLALGHRRAASVAKYLSDQGLPRDRLTTSSMGEIEATGTDTESWARDRKVEILLGDEAVIIEEEGIQEH